MCIIAAMYYFLSLFPITEDVNFALGPHPNQPVMSGQYVCQETCQYVRLQVVGAPCWLGTLISVLLGVPEQINFTRGGARASPYFKTKQKIWGDRPPPPTHPSHIPRSGSGTVLDIALTRSAWKQSICHDKFFKFYFIFPHIHQKHLYQRKYQKKRGGVAWDLSLGLSCFLFIRMIFLGARRLYHLFSLLMILKYFTATKVLILCAIP